MTIEKRSSGKAAVECRFNPVQRRWRCNIALGRNHVGPLFVRVPDEAGDAADAVDEAARSALARAVERGLVDFDDLEHDGGTFVVHADHEGTKRGRPTDRKATAKAKAKAKAPVQVEGKTKRVAPIDRSAKRVASAHVEANGKRATPVERKAPGAEKPGARTATKPKRSVAPMGEEKAHAIVGNGAETRALEDHYLDVKDEYHGVGEALKERHLAVAAIAAQAR